MYMIREARRRGSAGKKSVKGRESPERTYPKALLIEILVSRDRPCNLSCRVAIQHCKKGIVRKRDSLNVRVL